MSYVMSAVQSSLYDDSGYDLFATLEVGDNGDPNGLPTSVIGDVNGEENWSTMAWDSNPAGTGGFDTGAVGISFGGAADGEEAILVGNEPVYDYNGQPFGSIQQLIIEAAVQIPAQVQLSTVQVSFLSGGTTVETDYISSGPSVNTINTPSSPVAEQRLIVTPSAPNVDQVKVSATLVMRSPGYNTPASNAMFCNIFVSNTGGNSQTAPIGGGWVV